MSLPVRERGYCVLAFALFGSTRMRWKIIISARTARGDASNAKPLPFCAISG